MVVVVVVVVAVVAVGCESKLQLDANVSSSEVGPITSQLILVSHFALAPTSTWEMKTNSHRHRHRNKNRSGSEGLR